jgi:chromosome segregation ATPase
MKGEIDRLHQRVADLQDQIHSNKRKRDDYRDQNEPVLTDMRDRQDEIDDLMARRKEIDIELEKIEEIKESHSAFFENVKRTYGIASIDEGLDRLENIDERIERETLTAPQLRKLLAAKDRIRKGIAFLNQSAQSQPDISPVREGERELRGELREILTFLHQLIEERKEIRRGSGDVYDNFKVLREEKKQLVSKLREARSQLDQKYDQREQVTDDFHDSLR